MHNDIMCIIIAQLLHPLALVAISVLVADNFDASDEVTVPNSYTSTG